MNHNSDFAKKFKKLSDVRRMDDYFELVQAEQEVEFKNIEGLIIEEAALGNITIAPFFLSNCNFVGCVFDNVSFDNCRFLNSKFQRCTFTDCKFYECTLEFCAFDQCGYLDGIFEGAELNNVSFSACHINGTVFRDVRFDENVISHSSLIDITIDATLFFLPEPRSPLTIRDTLMFKCSFEHFDFTDCNFRDCDINASIFVDVTFGEKSFSGKVRNVDSQYSSIDLQSLRNSAPIPFNILETVFGIHAPDIQSYAHEMLSKLDFHKVFISYSFKDSAFAELINSALLAKGIFTFLWKKDAPGGQRLKKIMYDNIQKFDKILFIASKNSLKSQACHFELSEGKKKYESTWEEVLFPIHIDNYLFEIQKHEIPRAHRELFYDNILELREIHSKDFSKFTTASLNDPEFNKSVTALIADLRKKP